MLGSSLRVGVCGGAGCLFLGLVGAQVVEGPAAAEALSFSQSAHFLLLSCGWVIDEVTAHPVFILPVEGQFLHQALVVGEGEAQVPGEIFCFHGCGVEFHLEAVVADGAVVAFDGAEAGGVPEWLIVETIVCQLVVVVEQDIQSVVEEAQIDPDVVGVSRFPAQLRIFQGGVEYPPPSPCSWCR